MADPTEAYDELDAAFITALRAGGRLGDLRNAAEAAGAAANLWQREAHALFFSLRGRLGPEHRDVIEAEIAAEKAEVLGDLWTDLASAVADRPDA